MFTDFQTKDNSKVTPFVEAFCKQIQEKEHKDLLEVLTGTNYQLASSDHEAAIIFSTLRKLIPIRNKANDRIPKHTLMDYDWTYTIDQTEGRLTIPK